MGSGDARVEQAASQGQKRRLKLRLMSYYVMRLMRSGDRCRSELEPFVGALFTSTLLTVLGLERCPTLSDVMR